MNQLVVAFEDPKELTLWGLNYRIESVFFFTNDFPTKRIELLGKTRYRDPSTPIFFQPLEDQKAEILFKFPQRALTPGQILAIYDGERLIGSGIYSHSELGRAMLSA